MRRAGLTTIAIHADTISAARKQNSDLFQVVKRDVSMILMSPEQLRSKRFEKLMNSWGQSFRKDFQQIGWARARLGSRVPMAAVTATLQVGDPTERVCKFLGFESGRFHTIRRSNYRPDVQFIFRTMTRGLENANLSDLDWVVDNGARRRTFWNKLEGDPNRAKRLRLFNSVNHETYNDQTLKLWTSNDPTFDDVIVYGEPPDTDELLQDYGRLRYLKSVSPRAFLYMTKSAHTKAAQLLREVDDLPMLRHTRSTASDTDTLQLSMARLIMAPCKVAQLDELYGNTLNEPPCTVAVYPSQQR
ncbi:hypothetical protein SCLCIDRAFT_1224439 [Scleroderma citrinum Foug A]|uniref:Uncharacterized protein n=1 Tax=Scleroderma citrinum Foug A TaxID=1036808 RepID=A0A0C3D561_9AGAM|nr:hypothetical protein SCLCIDRAFT_1224439 [Scleroderma citrinum Foug A]